MKAKTEVRETYYQCCWCGETFPDEKGYKDHYDSKFSEGDYNHGNWVRLFKDQKGYMQYADRLTFREHLRRKRKRICLVLITSIITGTIFGIFFDSILLAGIISGLTVVVTYRFLIGNLYGSE